MNNFIFSQAESEADAIELINDHAGAKFIGGGTNLVDLMKANVTRPSELIDINHLPLKKITKTDQGGLSIGALVTNSEVAYNFDIESRYPLLSKAILAGASAQLRNMATTGGNLLQRTRCYYFYDKATPCNKRHPGTGCSAINGINRIHAILGASSSCIAVHPSDMCVALSALSALVRVRGPKGNRTIPFSEFHRLPNDTPHIDTNLKANELILSVDLPEEGFAANNTYLKIRDRASYAFALVSVAAAAKMDGDKIVDARIAMGGVAHKPWRNPALEGNLKGLKAEHKTFRDFAEELLKDAKGCGHNDFKIELGKRAIVRAMKEATAPKELKT